MGIIKLKNMNVNYKNLLCVICAFMVFTFMSSSCTDENVGEFYLSGSIENLIPENSYSLDKTSTTNGFIIFTPKLDSNFQYWGLTLQEVGYYIDGELYNSVSTEPFELVLKPNDIAIGNHKLSAKMKVVGEKCNDVILSKDFEFSVSTDGNITEQHGDFYIDYNRVSTGDILEITPFLNKARSSSGCEIDEVKYYWDGKLIGTETQSPFKLKYQVNDAADSQHSINVTIYYHDDSSSKLTYNWSYSIYRIYDQDDYMLYWDIKSNRNDYINGESIDIIAKLYKGNNVNLDFEIEFYLDDELIGKSKEFPYTLEYKLSNLSIGTHKITGKSIYKKKDGYSTTNSDKTIIITK